MINWKIDRELFSGNYQEGKKYSHIANELEEVKDSESNKFRVRKNITYSLFLTLILNSEYEIESATISFMNLFNSVYEFDAPNFYHLIAAIKDEIGFDGNDDFESIKKYLLSYDELAFISFLDENGIEREHK
ncbi:MAG: hypothetical protein ACI4U5_01390 [Bacilli bacterium]